MAKYALLRVSRRKLSSRLRGLLPHKLHNKWDPHKKISENWRTLATNEILATLPAQIVVKPAKLSEADAGIIERLLQRHGTNIGAMVRDTKLNRWQWEARTLKKYIQFYESGRRVQWKSKPSPSATSTDKDK